LLTSNTVRRVQGLRQALAMYEAEILASIPTSLKEMTLFLQTEDYPLQRPMFTPPDGMAKWALPVLSMCLTEDSYDVAVPEYAFVDYKDGVQVRRECSRSPVCSLTLV
jgi:Glycosyl transferase family 90